MEFRFYPQEETEGSRREQKQKAQSRRRIQRIEAEYREQEKDAESRRREERAGEAGGCREQEEDAERMRMQRAEEVS